MFRIKFKKIFQKKDFLKKPEINVQKKKPFFHAIINNQRALVELNKRRPKM